MKNDECPCGNCEERDCENCNESLENYSNEECGSCIYHHMCKTN